MFANKYLIGAAAIGAAVLAFWLHGEYKYRQGVNDTTVAAKLAAADQYRDDVGRMNASVAVLQTRITELQNAKPEVITRWRERVVQTPLPDTCRIDDDRLHELQRGLSKARTTGEPGGTVP